MLAEKIISAVFSNGFVFVYYQYMDKFKVRPESFEDLFDYLDFQKVDNKLLQMNRAMSKLRDGE